MVNFTVRIYTEGVLSNRFYAKDSISAYETALKYFEEVVDLGELQEADVTANCIINEKNGNYVVDLAVEGFYDYEVSTDDVLEEDEILLRAQEEGWSEANFGELENLDIQYSEVVDSWES